VLARRQIVLGLAAAPLASALSACAQSAAAPAQAPAVAQADPDAAMPANASFDAWLAAFRREAAKQGISQRTLDEALRGVVPSQRVIELDRRQPESTLTFDQYVARVISQARIDTGRRRIEEHRALLTEVSSRYGVQPRFIVALWAMESDFGRITGNFSVVQSLATLAHEGRRRAFFQDELIKSLRIVDRGYANTRDLRGSWAGAMGQCQFMPSSYLAYAVDHDGDGRRDIWNSLPDVFASIANYLKSVGWVAGQTWGREVATPADLPTSQIDAMRVVKSMDEWRAQGVRLPDGSPLPAGNLQASLARPSGGGGRTFMAYPNYRAIMRWNRSVYFATAVGMLADQIQPS